MKTTPLFAYLFRTQDHEIIVGTVADLQPWQKQGYQLVCCISEEELYQAVAPYRRQEWIITTVSFLPIVQERLHLLMETKESDIVPPLSFLSNPLRLVRRKRGFFNRNGLSKRVPGT